jgi:hypothetical protein
MLFIPSRSICLHIPNTGPDRDPSRGHLYIILNNICENGNHLLVPVCSARDKCDKTCLLGKGDHDFIKHDSFVAYNLMRIYASSHLTTQVNAGVISREGVMDEKIFARVHEGVRNSRLSAKVHIKYLFGNEYFAC